VGLIPGVASDEILKMISNIVSKTGDVRTAIRLLKNAAVYCENHNFKKITPEDVRCVNLEFSPLTYDDLIHFSIHELFLLKAICVLLIAQNSQVIPLNEIKEEYFSICNEFQSSPRSNTQIWEYIQNLKKYDIISTTVKNKKIRGRRTYIGISEYSAKKIGDEINIIIKNREDFLKND
jgi:Cdc6-like AAA superfamily ATPase